MKSKDVLEKETLQRKRKEKEGCAGIKVIIERRMEGRKDRKQDHRRG